VLSNAPQELLLLGTFQHLFLCDSQFNVLATLYYALRRPPIQLPPLMMSMARLSLMEHIPELSLAIVGSQGCATVLLVRIVRNSINSKHELMPEKVLPEEPLPSPLAGMVVTRHVQPNPYLSHWKLYILYQNSRLYCYEIRKGASDLLDISTTIL
jgi:hypothetical protein